MQPLGSNTQSNESDHQENQVLPFPGHRSARQRWVDIRALVEEVVDMLAPQLRNQRVHVEMDVPHTQRVWADDTSLRRCVWHLALNALDSMPKGGELSVTAYVGPQRFELEIADSGRGISDDFRRRIANPRISVNESGMGHQLATAVRLARAQGGEVMACNCPEGGAAFTIRLPHRALRAAA